MFLRQQYHSKPIQDYLFRQPEPNLSIKIEQVQQKTKHTFICECQMCRQYAGKKALEMLALKTDKINKKIKEKVQNSKIPSQYFLEIVKKLVLPHHKIVKRGIDIYIPEVCFFKQGQSKGIFMNRQLDDISIKKIHKNSVNPGLIAKIFNQRRRNYKEELKKALGKSDRRPLTQNKNVNQKAKKQSAGIQQKDAVILKHTDGFESMMTQTQFIMLTLRRKQDPIWKTIQMVKNIINVHDQLKNIFFVKYQKDNVKYANLLQRTKVLTRIYAQNIIPGESAYISNEEQIKFSLQLLKTDKNYFAEYVVYKIVSFIEFFFDEQIQKLSCKILINQVNKPYLIDVTSYKKKTLIKFTWTNDTYKKKMKQQQRKLFVDRAIQVTQELQQKSSVIKELMESKYTELKNKYGISLQESDNEEEIKNNQFFKRIYPEFNNQELSQVLLNEKNISILGFKKKYLGYRQSKKPIVKDFCTHLINVLHKTTPQLKVSEYHGISFKPNETGIFSSKRVNTCSIKKRGSLSLLSGESNLSRRDSVESCDRNDKRQKSKQSTSRTRTSATYRKSGCHLHTTSFADSYIQKILNK